MDTTTETADDRNFERLYKNYLHECQEVHKQILDIKIIKISPHQNGTVFVKFNNGRKLKISPYWKNKESYLVDEFFRTVSISISKSLVGQTATTNNWNKNRNLIQEVMNRYKVEIPDHLKERIKNLADEILQKGFNSPKMKKKLEERKESKKKFSMKFSKKRLSFEIKEAIKLDLTHEDLIQIFNECLAESIIQS